MRVINFNRKSILIFEIEGDKIKFIFDERKTNLILSCHRP